MAPLTRLQIFHASFHTSLTVLSETNPAYDPPITSRLSKIAVALHTSAAAPLAAISKLLPPHNTKLVCVSIAIINLAMKWLLASATHSNQNQHLILQSMQNQQVEDLYTQFFSINSRRYLAAWLPRGWRQWFSDQFKILFNEPEAVFMRLVCPFHLLMSIKSHT